MPPTAPSQRSAASVARRSGTACGVLAACALSADCRWHWPTVGDGDAAIDSQCPLTTTSFGLRVGTASGPATVVRRGETLYADLTMANPSGTPTAIGRILVAGRRPRAPWGGPPFDDLEPTFVPPRPIASGASVTVQASRTFTASDPPGVWRFYPYVELPDTSNCSPPTMWILQVTVE
jgi:hypothetical protein